MNRAGRLAVVFVAALGASRVVAGLPDWAKPIAAAAPTVPDGAPEWPERTLLRETSIVVSPDGATWRIHRRVMVQVLSNRVAEMQFGGFAFDDTTKMKKSKGWHVPPGERAERNVGGAVDMAISDEFLTDSKARIVALEGVRKGSLVVYEFDAESRPYVLTTSQPFYDDAPVAVDRWSIEMPPGWGLKHAWLPGPGPAPQRKGTAWIFEQRDFTPLREEKLGDGLSDVGPRLVVALEPPAGQTSATPAFTDWNAMGTWYQDLAKGRDSSTPAIDAAVKTALAGAGPASLDRIRAVSLLVRDRVRYVAREVGIGGYQPHYASQVFTGLYGDCKDKGTLLRAGLSSAGFVSYPILINASNPNTLSPDVPCTGSFNHFVIGVRWPKDEAIPSEAASAMVDAGADGKLLVVDPTDERTWPGTLPDNLAGKTGLAVIDGRGVLVTLPSAEPAWHRIARTLKVSLGAGRTASVQRVSRFYGGPAEAARGDLAASFKERRDDVERHIRATWPGAEVKDYEVVAEDKDGAYVETVAFSLPAGAPTLQEGTYWLFSGATSDIDRVPLTKRTVAVKYPYPFEVRYETTVEGVPAAYTLPSAQSFGGEGWKVESTVDRTGGAVHGIWSATLRQTRFEPAAFPALKQFWSSATKAASPGVSLP